MTTSGPHYQAGDKLLDVYIVERVLGEGGFNDVYLARHQILPRRYAIKVLRSTIAETQADLERLTARVEREAIVLARFDHPNLPTLHDMRLEAGAPVLVLEYLEGFNLEVVLDKVHQLSVQDALYVGIEIAKPLAIAHQRDIVHRDIKPANIFCMTEEPPEGKAVVRLLDFGASRLLGEAKRLTKEHRVVGTMYYVAPEALMSAGKPDHRVDIYALGLVLWESLAGCHPFDMEGTGVPPQQMGFRHVGETPAYIRDLRPDVPTRFADLIKSMLAKNPAERPQTFQVAYDEMWAVLSTMKHSMERTGQKLPSIFTRKGAVLPGGKPFSSRRAPRSVLLPAESGPTTDVAPGTQPLSQAAHSNTAADGLYKPTQESAHGLLNPAMTRTQESHQVVGPRPMDPAIKPTLVARGDSLSPRGTELLPKGPVGGTPASTLAQRMLDLGQAAPTPGNREMLEAALTHESAEVRRAATQSLSRVGNALSRVALSRVVATEADPHVRYVMELTIDLLTSKDDPPAMVGTVRMNDGFAPAAKGPPASSPVPKSAPTPLLRPTAKDLPIVTTLVDESNNARATLLARLATSALTGPRVEERVRSLKALHETSPVHGHRVELAKRAIDALDVQLDDDGRARSLAELRAGGVDQLLIQTLMRGAMRPVSERMQAECIALLASEGDSRHALFLEQLKRDYVLSPAVIVRVDQAIANVASRVPIDLPSILPLPPPTPQAGSSPSEALEKPRSVFAIRRQDVVAIVSAMIVVCILAAVLFATKVLGP